MDEYTRECLTLVCDRSITIEDVIKTLAELFAMRGVPAHIHSDNSPGFVAKAIGRLTEQLVAFVPAGQIVNRQAIPRFTIRWRFAIGVLLFPCS